MVEVAAVDPGHPHARFCIASYLAELDRRFPNGFDPAASITADDDELRPPAGVLLVATEDGEPVGCGALKLHDGAPAEIKRMWVADAARGKGVGRRLLRELETYAAAHGARAARLETNGTLTEAIALYRSSGYREVPAFNAEAYAHHWFEKDLPAPWRAVVLVEGTSDVAALTTLAQRRGRDLTAEGVALVPIGGATNIRHALRAYAAPGVRLAGLCDEAEEGYFRRALEHAGLGRDLTRARMAALGFHVCVRDLEDELMRALGPARVEEVIVAQGDGPSWRIFQRQPHQRGRSAEAQQRRFMGTRSGRKDRMAAAMTAALDLSRVPQPLDAVLADVAPA